MQGAFVAACGGVPGWGHSAGQRDGVWVVLAGRAVWHPWEKTAFLGGNRRATAIVPLPHCAVQLCLLHAAVPVPGAHSPTAG